MPCPGSTWRGIGSGVRAGMKGLSLGASPWPPIARATSQCPHSHCCRIPSHTHAPVRRPPPGPPAPAAVGFQGLDLWAESAQGAIDLKSHRKVNLGSKQPFCRWFLKNAKEADRSHSLNVSNSCKAGAGSGFTPDCCPRGPRGQGVSCRPLSSCLLPTQEQDWGDWGLRRTEGGLETGSPFWPF